LYPTVGFGIGLIKDPEWAAIVATAYNNWIEARYTSKDPRLFAAGLLPLQAPQAAVAEIQRCTRRTNIRSLVLPSVNATGKHLGHRDFWPIYEAAERAGMPIAIHGSPSGGFGLDSMDEFVKVHTLSHPMPLFMQLTDLYFSGVFDAFPRLRFAFLEGGCGWVPWMLERLTYEYTSIFGIEARKRLARSPRQVICDSDQFWVSTEPGEELTRACMNTMGSDRLLYASDYPHEPPEDGIRREIDGFFARGDLGREEKAKIMGGNARRFLRLG
jgi:predicted TIM-barrel fold metal-dependent hydrolase